MKIETRSDSQIFLRFKFYTYFQLMFIVFVLAQLDVLRAKLENTNRLSQHEALKGVHVHEKTLCVTSGAHRFGTHFLSLPRCSKYTAIHMLSRTHVRQTTLCVAFGARPCLVPSNLLGRLFGHLGRQDSPSTPGRPRRATIWAPNIVQGCPPDLTSARPRLPRSLPSGIFRRRERRAHEVA